MKTQDHLSIAPVDMHSALARAHADRAEYIRLALLAVPALVQRIAAKLRPNRTHLPHNGAWA